MTAAKGCTKHCPRCGGPAFHFATGDTGRWYGCRACEPVRYWQAVEDCTWCQPELVEAS